MITGDHPLTARAIAKRLSIIESYQNSVITGVEMNTLSDTQLETRVGCIRVYARASPEQ